MKLMLQEEYNKPSVSGTTTTNEQQGTLETYNETNLSGLGIQDLPCWYTIRPLWRSNRCFSITKQRLVAMVLRRSPLLKVSSNDQLPIKILRTSKLVGTWWEMIPWLQMDVTGYGRNWYWATKRRTKSWPDVARTSVWNYSPTPARSVADV